MNKIDRSVECDAHRKQAALKEDFPAQGHAMDADAAVTPSRHAESSDKDIGKCKPIRDHTPIKQAVAITP